MLLVLKRSLFRLEYGDEDDVVDVGKIVVAVGAGAENGEVTGAVMEFDE